MLSAMFMVFLGRITHILKSFRLVCLLHTEDRYLIKHKIYFFMCVVRQEILNMKIYLLLVSEIDLNIQ